jgi:predicted amidohydrolase YtcJ
MRLLLPIFAGMLAVASVASRQTDAPPDAIYFNGKVVTVDSNFTVAQAFAVRNGEFVAVGTTAKIKTLAAKNTRQVDLKGATVIPGLSDNHDHLWDATKYLRQGVDMVGVTSLAEMQSRLRAAVVKAKPGDVVFTTTGWAIRPAPTRKDIDAVSTDVPIVVVGSRRGTGALNSAAFKLAGVTKENPTFEGGRVRTDDSGELAGNPPPYPQAILLMDKLLPAWTPGAQEEMIAQGMRERNALGITSIRELQVWPEAVASYYRLWRQSKLTLRVALGIEFPDQANTAQHLKELGIGVPFGDHWLRMDSVGEEPWTPGTMAAKPWTDLVLTMNRLGWRPAPHVFADPARGTGPDEATNNTLDAYEAADRESSIKDKRWYLEHVPFATPEQMERMAKLGVIVSVQDAGYNPGFPIQLPKERFEHQNPVREFLDHKLVVIGGSDYGGPNPIEKEPNNPMIPFYFYVTRKSRTGETVGGDEKISREDALRIFTVNPAFATFEEDVKGGIAPGMLADFVVLNQDIMTVPDEKILETHPLATFVGGKKVYAAEHSNF